MQDLLYALHDLVGDKAILNVLLVTVLWQLRRAPMLIVALCLYLAKVGKRVGVADEDTGTFVKAVRAHTQPHGVPTIGGTE